MSLNEPDDSLVAGLMEWLSWPCLMSGPFELLAGLGRLSWASLMGGLVERLSWPNSTTWTVGSIRDQSEVIVATLLSSHTTEKAQLNQPIYYQHRDIKVI
jgi:hypothetical protein